MAQQYVCVRSCCRSSSGADAPVRHDFNSASCASSSGSNNRSRLRRRRAVVAVAVEGRNRRYYCVINPVSWYL
jgi:hypothetical protein